MRIKYIINHNFNILFRIKKRRKNSENDFNIKKRAAQKCTALHNKKTYKNSIL